MKHPSLLLANMPSPSDIQRTSEWLNLESVIDVREFYQLNNAHPVIQRIVSLENRKFGSVVEKILREHFQLSPPESSRHDAIFRRIGRRDTKLEIKAARYWAGTNNCKWQHLEPNYDFTHILFVLIDFHKMRVWIAEKEPLFSLGYLTKQGQQGYWGEKNQLLSSGRLTEIETEEDLAQCLP